jgi:isopentenyl-diphosphate delta-isomerase
MVINMEEQVILVDENDRAIGVGEKCRTHLEGQLHRALSVFIFNRKGELLLQKRAPTKYHSGGLWSNTCCSHPRPGEEIEAAAHRRLQEEMGFDCELKEAVSFIYKAELDHSFIEYEYDHILIGQFEGEPRLNIDEAMDWRWIDMKTLREDLQVNQEDYTYWLRFIVDNYRMLDLHFNPAATLDNGLTPVDILQS